MIATKTIGPRREHHVVGTRFSWIAPVGRRLVIAMLSLLTLPAGRGFAEQEIAPESADSADQHFTLKILPLLKDKCLGCHGGDPNDIKGDFDIRDRASVLLGGESDEPAVVPGDADDSPLYWAVRWDGLEMPPKENDRLTDQQIDDVRRWINQGAPWPDEKTRERIRIAERQIVETDEGWLIATSGGLSDEWTYRRYQPSSVWAFQPLRSDHDHHSIDGFINDRLREADLPSAPLATPEILIRRVTYDLIGLPPSHHEITAFAQAYRHDADEAWENLIDRLLASPHYGERWAQHWLDVVRYADTAGYSNDYERSNAWRYRDYVVRSLNEDKPYDRFVREQIAGDELFPDDPEAMIATGFLRMGPWGTAMITQDEARQIYRDDLVHNVGQSFLSIPMRCCKCHDHKFDPIPTRDYYRLYAAFSTTHPAEREVDFLSTESTDDFEDNRQLVESLLAFAKEKTQVLVDKREAAAKAWYAENDLPYKNWGERKNDPEDSKPPRHVGLTEAEQGRLKVREQDVWIWQRRLERFQPLIQGVYTGQNQNQNGRKLRPPKQIDPSWSTESHILTGGALTAPGPTVVPGVLSGTGVAVDGAPDDAPYTLPTTVSGRRAALAKWITDPQNPLTARSIVNRVWQHHFGHGLVKTANNFGVKGDRPSHPELLDWLARRFIDDGWKIKNLHRSILMSDVYRRSGRHPDPETLATVDPDNRLRSYFPPRRLTAEEIRDSMLVASGELNRRVGGLPAMPEINMEVALEPRMIQFSLAPAYQPSRTPESRNRRSLYAYRVRGQADPFMEVLNKPTPNESCERRDSAAVSPQAFTLLNSELVADRSIATAVSLVSAEELDDPSSRRLVQHAPELVNNAFTRILGRRPTRQQRDRLVDYIIEMTRYHHQHQPKPVQYATHVTRSLVEELSGKPFEYEEWLPVFEDYQPDAKAADVSAATRALADLCLVLFNTNEFAYVY